MGGAMNERLQVFKCEQCGNIVEVLHGAGGKLFCCGQPMNFMEEQTADQSLEKHVPVVEPVGDGIKATVGSVPHPMLDKHYIEWIEVVTSDGVCRKYLKPGDKPEAVFKVTGQILKVREYCNLHGLWRG